jgi:hypothetical protein
MDIHKPKPFHNWREFLKEYGIIVLGVLTALGLEQAIEAYHEREQVKASADAVDAELHLELSKAKFQLSFKDCTDRQLVALANAIGRDDQAEVRRLMSGRTFAGPMAWSNSAWQALHASDVSNYLDTRRQLAYPILYSVKDNIVTTQDRYKSSLFRLQALAQKGVARSSAIASTELAELAEMTGAWRELNDEEQGFLRTASGAFGFKSDVKLPNKRGQEFSSDARPLLRRSARCRRAKPA